MRLRKQFSPNLSCSVCMVALLVLILVGGLSVKAASAHPQTLEYTESIPGLPISLLAGDGEQPFRVYAERRESPMAATSTTIIINYVPPGHENGLGDMCVEWPEGSQAAFDYAASIWAAELTSSVPIKINACWAKLDYGVLGHSAATGFLRGESTPWYPVALLNAIVGKDLNDSDGKDSDNDGLDTDSEMEIAYSNNGISWHFGTDGNTPMDQYDFVSVVLHEICHGLGFAGMVDIKNGKGIWGLGSGIPGIYDRFTENGAGEALLDFGDNSTALAKQLTGGDVYFRGENAMAANNGTPPKLYAPSLWNGGSSYSHLDENFNGTINSLMTYSLDDGESNHNTGPITRGILLDIGWPGVTEAPTPTVEATAKTPSPNSPGHIFLPLVARAYNGQGPTPTTPATATITPTQPTPTVTATPTPTLSPTPTSPPAPAAPSNLLLTPISHSSIALAWMDNSDNEDGFQVERAPGGTTSFTIVATLPANTTHYTDSGLTSSTPYSYRVRAIGPSGTSDYCPTQTASTLAAPSIPPVAPTNLRASDIAITTALLNWDDNSDNENGFRIEQYTPSGYVELGTVEENSTGVTITDMSPNTEYRFRVRAYNAVGNSDYSNIVTFTTQGNTTATRFINNTPDPIVSLVIDGVEMFPHSPNGIPSGYYYEISLSPGQHTYTAWNGWWQENGTRFTKYHFSGTFNQQNNVIGQVPLNITIAEVLTRQSSSAYWEGDYWVDLTFHYAAFCFYSNGTFRFYDDGQQIGTGSFSLVSWGDLFTTFRVSTGSQQFDGYLYEVLGEFNMRNGPPSWPQITYNINQSVSCPVSPPFALSGTNQLDHR